ncbi:MAG: DNA translocase FtsK [Alphaproteobacteria bacterium]
MSTARRGYGVYQPRSRRGMLADALANIRAAVARTLSEAIRRTIGVALFLFMVLALLALASFDPADPALNVATARAPANWLGAMGAYGADLMLQGLGLAVLAFVLPLGAWGWRLAAGEHISRFVWRAIALVLGTLFVSVALGALSAFAQLPAGAGGLPGQVTDVFIGKVAESFGAWLRYALPVLFFVLGANLAWLSTGIRAEPAIRAARFVARHGVRAAKALRRILRRGTHASADYEDDEPFEEYDDDGFGDPTLRGMRPEPLTPHEGARVLRNHDRRKALKPKSDRQPALNLGESEYQLPPLGFLSEPPKETSAPAFSDDALEENARLLETVLADFGVRGRIVAVRPGPVVTLYEFEPAAGVKSSRVVSLSDDIARSMSSVAARVAVIPGRNVIGIELPNGRRETVYLRELLAAPEYEKSRAPLTLALGKTIGGEPVMADLAKMPHLLIAGTTGSGKSVALNTMILSLLFRLPPSQCRMILIDPKLLELSVYEAIPHLLTPVVIDPRKAIVALKWAVREMEQRYGKMAKLGARGVEAFNERVRRAREKGEVLKRTVQTGFDRETGRPIYEDEVLELEPMPYIIIVVDEMADLMMISGKEIEGAVQRLAQMARAAGIHLIAATQRPSVDVITGTIKANFPTRISFQVTSRVDSRTILGEQGAEQLLGQGDMLYMMAGGRIRRVHGPFVNDHEVEDVVRFLKTQGTPEYLEAVTEELEEDEDDPYGLYGEDGSGDDLFNQAVAIVARDRKVSTSYIQRRLQIGYNRAARLIERMEDDGMITKPNHQGRREILLPERGD